MPGSGSAGRYDIGVYPADLLAVQAALGLALSGSPASLIFGALDSGQCASIIFNSDSTGAGNNTLIYRFLTERLIPARPNDRVVLRQFNDSTQKYNAPIVLQAGASGERHVQFFGGGTNRTRQISATSIADHTTDFELQVRVAADDWTPAATQCIAAHNSGVGFRGWTLKNLTNGDITFNWNPDPAVETTITLTGTAANLGFVDGTAYDIKVTIDIDNGGGGYTATMYKSSDFGATWTQVVQIVTSAGTTTVGKPVGVAYEIGGRGTTTEPFAGKIYEIFIRDGIDGPTLNPVPIDAWNIPSGTSRLGGTPTLYVWQGAVVGKNFSYFNDTTRFPKLNPIAAPCLVILNDSHNENALRGSEITAPFDAWLAAHKARNPMATFAMIAQNPENISIVATAESHGARVREMAAHALTNGVAVIDFMRAMMLDGRGLGVLVKTDGVHPSEPDGYTVGIDAMWRYFGPRAAR